MKLSLCHCLPSRHTLNDWTHSDASPWLFLKLQYMLTFLSGLQMLRSPEYVTWYFSILKEVSSLEIPNLFCCAAIKIIIFTFCSWSGVPFTATSALIGTLSGWVGSVANVCNKPTRSSSSSPSPIIPPVKKPQLLIIFFPQSLIILLHNIQTHYERKWKFIILMTCNKND